ncbi:MAG: UbiD family decarboxylase [Acidobacteria bacterium]|nr:UbiD family decarboxylase [Acidobacteriota bacterium]
MHRNLRSFLGLLRQESDLVEVGAEVDPDLELAEIHRRVIERGGPALLFKNVKGSRYPVVTNLFGTARRITHAFGPKPEALVRQAVHVAESLLPPKPAALWQHRSLALDALKLGTKKVRRAPVTEVADRPARLDELPVLTTWQEDGGPFFTLPLVYTEHPATRKHNLGMYRMQRFDARTTGMHWQIHKGGGFHYHEAEAAGRALPVTMSEGPFGDHYGYYSLRHDYPVFNVEAVFHRRDAVYPATVVGKPRQEDFFIGDYLQKLLSPLFPLVMPSVRDLWTYGETGFHSLAAAVVRERYAREALVSAFRILGEGQLSLTKFLLLTDTPQDLSDFRTLLAHVLARFRPESDLFVFSNLSMDTLDYTSGTVNRGSKAVLLGLGEPVRELPREFRGELPAGVARAEVFCPGCLVVEGGNFEQEPELAARLGGEESLRDWPLVVLHDDAGVAASAPDFLWATWTRFEPASDIHASSTSVRRHHISYSAPLVIDARMKPGYPDELLVRPDIADLVTRRWREYFPRGLEGYGG